MDENLTRQIQFLIEVDKLKLVYRQTLLMDRSRQENDAEHSWHLALMAFLLADYALAENLDMLRVLKLVLVHDLVEIDAGDTFVYDEAGYFDKKEREQKAAGRIFGILPDEQAREINELWVEFEQRETAEAQYAAAIDRFQPILHNYFTEGAAWRKHGVAVQQVIAKNRHIKESAPKLWNYVEKILKDAVAKGYLADR